MISKKEVQHIAHLSKLNLTKKEEDEFQKDLSSILDYAKKLKQADISKVEPCFHPIKIENVTREDSVKISNKFQYKGKKNKYIKVESIL